MLLPVVLLSALRRLARSLSSSSSDGDDDYHSLDLYDAGGEDGEGSTTVTAHDWMLGVAFSVLASVIGGASKLSIRKSWLIHAEQKRRQRRRSPGDTAGNGESYEVVRSPTATNENGFPASLPAALPASNEAGFDNDGVVAPLEVSPRRGSSGFSEEATAATSPEDEDGDSGVIGVSRGRRGGYSLFDNMADLSRGGALPPLPLSPLRLSWLLYLSGMVGMSLLNPLCCVLAMRYANPSILAPFSGLTLVWVVLFSGWVVGEPSRGSQRAACALIVTGEVLVAAFGDHTNGEGTTVEEALASYREPAFVAFMVFMTLFLLQLGILIYVCPKTSLLRKVAWGTIGGSVTGFQNFLKDSLTIMSACAKQSQPYPPILYFFIAMGMLTAFVGLLFLSACMKRYDATYSAAMFVVSFVVSASIMSLSHYHTLDHLGGADYLMYPLGLVTLIVGAFVLAREPGAMGALGPASGGGEEVSANSSYLSDSAETDQGGDVAFRERLLNDPVSRRQFV